MEKCINCGSELTGKYCHHCGQERAKRLEVKTILHDVTHGILHWENSILKTFKLLALNPGNTAKEYITGRRKSFIKPFSYFIFIQTMFVIVFHLMSEKYFAFLNVSVQSSSDTLQAKVVEIQHLISNYINYLNYFMPIVFLFIFTFSLGKKPG